MSRGAWWATVHGVAKSQTQLKQQSTHMLLIQYNLILIYLTNYLCNGHEFEQSLEDSEGEGIMVCSSLWGRKESDMTEQQHGQRPYFQIRSHSEVPRGT